MVSGPRIENEIDVEVAARNVLVRAAVFRTVVGQEAEAVLETSAGFVWVATIRHLIRQGRISMEDLTA